MRPADSSDTEKQPGWTFGITILPSLPLITSPSLEDNCWQGGHFEDVKVFVCFLDNIGVCTYLCFFLAVLTFVQTLTLTVALSGICMIWDEMDDPTSGAPMGRVKDVRRAQCAPLHLTAPWKPDSPNVSNGCVNLSPSSHVRGERVVFSCDSRNRHLYQALKTLYPATHMACMGIPTHYIKHLSYVFEMKNKQCEHNLNL